MKGAYRVLSFAVAVALIVLSLFSCDTRDVPFVDKTVTVKEDYGNYILVKTYKDKTERECLHKYVLFGEYPQTKKSADVDIVSDTPDTDGYYLGSDGERYARVTAERTTNDAEFVRGEEYYFKVEPISWNIAIEEEGRYFLSTSSLDYLPFDDDSSNWKESNIRSWLNNGFMEKAFDVLERSIILETKVDNSADGTMNPNKDESWMLDCPYLCENTLDKVYLPSRKEIITYGMGGRGAGDYIIALGFNNDDGGDYSPSSWTRSPAYIDPMKVQARCASYEPFQMAAVCTEKLGVAPCLWISVYTEK